ncbi:hypothetical protein PGT21_023749 [Puccinia graminis f. sp. tritici]|uniref:RING-type domain-containing protein n=1 Tax=Puccinia graminis f. sp. tritici TaxID=56615 RepID=A0A5B0M7E6_PUCGR|nr:hypothetical protein PGT21_023749 [Puccinia graminis f. sp. tritici]KAA1072645.1 hypothetical protein PGTUg99_007714 [Puccinia graminis f. sp. tritici]
MLAKASYFSLILLFHVSDQISLRPPPREQILDNLAQLLPGTSTQPTRAIGGSSGSNEALSQLADSKKPKPPLTNCPVCQDPLRWNLTLDLKKIRVKRWPNCQHGYHMKCFQEMVDRKMKCAICQEEPPPPNLKRLKALERRLSLIPPEIDDENENAAEQIQREMYMAEADPGLTRSGDPELDQAMSFSHQEYYGIRDGGFSPRSPHARSHPDLSPSHSGPHHSNLPHNLGVTGLHGDDETAALIVALSLEHDVHHPPHDINPSHNHENPSTWQDTSGDYDLAMALSLQEELYHEPQLPPRELETAWSGPDTTQDEHYAWQVQRELNEQGPPLTQPISHGNPQSTPLWYLHPTAQGHEWQEYPV